VAGLVSFCATPAVNVCRATRLTTRVIFDDMEAVTYAPMTAPQAGCSSPSRQSAKTLRCGATSTAGSTIEDFCSSPAARTAARTDPLNNF
jgi:hypothetical protein